MQQKRLEIPLSDGVVGFAVEPKIDCPHFIAENQKAGMQNCMENGKELFQKPCKDCDKHSIQQTLNQLSAIKFKQENQQQTQKQDLNVQMQTLQVNEKLDYEEFIAGLKSKKYKNICVLAGENINFIRINFRCLPLMNFAYSLERYDFKGQMADILFNIDYFKSNPEPFYTVARKFYDYHPEPNSAHHLLKQLDLRNQLAMCITLHNGGNELEVGVTPEKVIQAYGNSKSAHCVQCYQQANINDFIEQLRIYKVEKCKKCETGLIKPDLVFEGENLPETYYQNIEKLKQGDFDLVLIIGSYLKDEPFKRCEVLIPHNTPIVVLGSWNIKRNNVLHIKGSITQNCQKILDELN